MPMPLTEFLDTHEQALTELAVEVVRDSRTKGSSFAKPWTLYVPELLAQARENVESLPWGDGPASWHLSRMRKLFEAHVQAVATRDPVRVMFKRDPPTHVVVAMPAEEELAPPPDLPRQAEPTVPAASDEDNIATPLDGFQAIESTVSNADYDRLLAMFTAKVERLDRTVHWVGEALGIGQDVDAP